MTLHDGHIAAISSVMHHHPHAHTSIYSNSLHLNTTQHYRSRGFNVDVVRYNCTSLSIGYAGESLGRLLQRAIEAAFDDAKGRVPDKATWQAAGKRVTGHKAFLTLLSEWMRYFLIYRFGGLYIDFDMLVLRPLIVPGAMNRLGVDYQHLNYAVQTQQTEGGAAPHAHTGFSCIEGSGSNGKESDAFRDRRGRPFTCVCNCILLFERFHPLLERALNLSHPMLNYYVAHHSFGAMRHYGLMTRVLLRAAGGDLDWAVSTDIKGKGSVAPRKAIEKKMVSTFEQMDTYAFSCQDRSLRNRWLTPVASRAGAANAELIISHCHVYHTGWGGGDAAKVNGSEATLWEGSVGQQLRARMTTLPPKMDALAELPSQPQR